MSRGLRSEVRKKGIRVIDILPGAVETKMWDRGARRKYGKRMMRPSDIAEVVVAVVADTALGGTCSSRLFD